MKYFMGLPSWIQVLMLLEKHFCVLGSHGGHFGVRLRESQGRKQHECKDAGKKQANSRHDAPPSVKGLIRKLRNIHLMMLGAIGLPSHRLLFAENHPAPGRAHSAPIVFGNMYAINFNMLRDNE